MELSSLFLAGKGSALTSFFSTAFLVVFLPFCLVVYSLMPRRGKKYFLLAADCAFFWLISGKLPSHKDDPEYSDWDTQADAFNQAITAELAKS